jgi:drug/metabolite transporter (DMT)-like permease
VSMAGAIERVPRLAVGVGALAVATSAVFIDLSEVSPGTATFFRCLMALPLLAVPALLERHRHGAIPLAGIGVAAIGGALFAGDGLLWTAAIHEVGAGLSSVLVNAQVVVVPLLAKVIDREALGARYLVALPGMILGVALTSGLIGGGGTAREPVAGTVHAIAAALCYSGFLYLLRRGGMPGRVVQQYWWVVASAAVVGLAVGALWQGVSLAPGWRAIGWLALTAVGGQVLGWLLVALASPRLPSTVGAALLLLTPIGALVLSAAVTGERPSAVQLVGVALVLGCAFLAATRRTAADPGRG